MATIGSLSVNVVANTGGFIKGMQRTTDLLGKFVNKVSLVSGAVTAAFGGMLAKFENTGSELHDMSAATGIAVEKLAFLKYAAEQSGASLETITKSARELQAKGIDPNQFEDIASSLASIENPTARAARTFEIFGKKAGAGLLPLLKDLPALKKRFEQLGGGFTAKMADAADRLGDAWGDVKQVLSNVTSHIAFALAPAIAATSEWIAENGKAIVEWIDDHQKLIFIVASTAAVLTTLAPALIAVSSAINIVSKAVVLLNVAMAFLSANPVVLWVLGISAAIVGVIALLEKLFGLWTKFKSLVGLDSDLVQPPAIANQPALAKSMPGVGSAAQQSAKAAKKTGPAQYSAATQAPTAMATSGPSGDPKVGRNTDSMVELLQAMDDKLARMTGTAPVQLAPSGVR